MCIEGNFVARVCEGPEKRTERDPEVLPTNQAQPYATLSQVAYVSRPPIEEPEDSETYCRLRVSLWERV